MEALTTEYLLYLEKVMDSIDLHAMYHSVMNSDTIAKYELIMYCEALYYKRLVNGGSDKEELSSILGMLKDEDINPSKICYLYTISRLSKLSKQSSINLYI